MQLTYAAQFDPVLVKGGPFDDFRFQSVVHLCDEFEGECLIIELVHVQTERDFGVNYLENRGGWNTMG